MLQRNIRFRLGSGLVLVVAALLGGSAWGVVVPAADIINLLRAPLLGLAGIGLALRWGAPWQGMTALLVLGGGAALLTRPVAMADHGDCARPLRVVQWNMRWDNPRRAEARAWLAAQDADVMILAEARFDLPEQLAELRPGRRPHAADCNAIVPCSTQLLTRVAPAAVRPLARGDAANRRALAAVRVDLAATADRPATTLLALHHSRPLPLGRQARETGWLAAAMADADPRWLIIGGDFNATPAMAPVRVLAGRFDLRRADAPGASWPDQPLPFLTIDHLLIGRGWRVMAARRGAALGSDHRAQIVDLCPLASGALAG